MTSAHTHVDFAPVLVARIDTDGMEDVPQELIDAHQAAVRELSNTTVAILHHLQETGQTIPWAFRADAMGTTEDTGVIAANAKHADDICDAVDNPPADEPEVEDPLTPLQVRTMHIERQLQRPPRQGVTAQPPGDDTEQVAPVSPYPAPGTLFMDAPVTVVTVHTDPTPSGRHTAVPRTRPAVLEIPGAHPTAIMRPATAPQPRTGDEPTGPLPQVPQTVPVPYRRTQGDTGAIPVIRDSAPAHAVITGGEGGDEFRPGWWSRRRAKRAAKQHQ